MTDESNEIPDRAEAARPDITAQIAAARQDKAFRERLEHRHEEERRLFERLAAPDLEHEVWIDDDSGPMGY